MLGVDLPKVKTALGRLPRFRPVGRLRSATGVLTCDLPASVGDLCEILIPHRAPVLAEVIGFRDKTAYLVPFDPIDAMRSGLLVEHRDEQMSIPVGPGVLGRVIDGLGRPLDGRGALRGCPLRPVHAPGPAPLARQRISTPFVTGQRVIDGLLTCGKGQRVGIFAGSGVGKSTLLAEIANGSNADVNVIAMIGERGREVKPFLEDCLGAEGLKRSVVVVATSDQSPLMRVRSAQSAIAIADEFRESGLHVLLLMDSVTRMAAAQREMGIALGEPPSARGYTPSVFSLLAKTMERLGNAERGGITAMLTVLVDGDDMEEPVSDAVRSLVDGHIVLDRKIAEGGRYPPVDVLRSISRTASDVADKAHGAATRKIRAVLQQHADARDLIRLGAYTKGTNPVLDKMIELMPEIDRFLAQAVGERGTYETTRREVLRLAAAWPF